ncbi:hypothetical protein [Pluralibacter gergoviae]|uniref:hypothetical protein n=1 Tax=Pluralibacter gergoviae TaxID=61647 RepID=UPI0006ABF362|nr:hypothetical protein [Pluralibacter gergoviae]KOQ93309.1 hypothetical protein ABW48_19900 [Pluralibacter gergoviae]
MTLLEILVKELPGKGGWPVGANYIAQDSDCSIYGFEEKPDLEDGHEWLDGTGGGWLLKVGILAESSDKSTSVITREQYEAALAESKKVAWSGEGLPPVGSRVEVKAEDEDWGWTQIDVVYVHNGEIIGIIRHESEYLNDRLEKFSAGYNGAVFRPIRSEEERKRDEAVEALLGAYFNAPPYDEPNEADRSGMSEVYSSIAAGKIPHIKIV